MELATLRQRNIINMSEDGKEDDDSIWNKAKRRFPLLAKILEALRVLQLFAFNVFMVAFDVGTDFYTAWAFYRQARILRMEGLCIKCQ